MRGEGEREGRRERGGRGREGGREEGKHRHGEEP